MITFGASGKTLGECCLRALKLALFLGVFLACFQVRAAQQVPNTETREPKKNTQTQALNKSDQMLDINDIKPLENIGVNPAAYRYAALAVAGVLLLFGAFLFWRRRKRRIPELEAVISPEQTALALLEQVKALMQTEPKGFYFELSMILREYIRQRFGVGAPEMTTEELLPRIVELRIEADLQEGVRDFALAGDSVKFAKRAARMGDMERHHQFVTTFVERTTPEFSDATGVQRG